MHVVSMPPLFIMIFVFLAIVITHAIKIENFTTIYPSAVSPNDTRIPLTLGLMVSFSGDYVTSSSVAGVQLALDLINENNNSTGIQTAIQVDRFSGTSCWLIDYASTQWADMHGLSINGVCGTAWFTYISPYRAMPCTGK